MSFAGFSEEDLRRMKSDETTTNNGPQINAINIKKLDKIGGRLKRPPNQYKLPVLQKQVSDDLIDNIDFQKCKLSLQSPTLPIHDIQVIESEKESWDLEDDLLDLNKNITEINANDDKTEDTHKDLVIENVSSHNIRKCSTDNTPDIVRGVSNYSEDELAAHRAKLEELQLKQKLMEEQNKKRKEMLAKALADRTKQTEEEVIRLEKIKKELQILDGQFSQDVSVLRKKIDQACLTYADAEKHYLRVEKEFLQAKINLQKEKEKKELLTEHLCALITHNETRKAQKLETLMLELATDKQKEIEKVTNTVEDEDPIIVDGVDQRTGKIVELPVES